MQIFACRFSAGCIGSLRVGFTLKEQGELFGLKLVQTDTSTLAREEG